MRRNGLSAQRTRKRNRAFSAGLLTASNGPLTPALSRRERGKKSGVARRVRLAFVCQSDGRGYTGGCLSPFEWVAGLNARRKAAGRLHHVDRGFRPYVRLKA